MSDFAGRAPHPIRPVSPAEFDAFDLVMQHAFHGSPAPPESAAIRAKIFEFPRSLAAFDDSSIIGTASAYSFSMTIPGGAVPCAGVTWVSVLPSHRRRGVLRSLMRRQLSDIGAAGQEPIAALWASEAGIYGRYGYGRASWHLSFNMHRGEGSLARNMADGLADGPRVRLVAPASAREALASVYDEVRASRPGFFARNSAWWDRVLSDPEASRDGAGPLRCVVASDSAGPRGYALYSGTQRWEDDTFLPSSALTVRELVACDAAASAALWGDLLSRDLTTSFRADLRPADDPVLFQLADARRVRPMICDGLWVRLIDVGAALSARRYSAPVSVVIAVRDRELPKNECRWRLTTTTAPGDGTGAASGGAASDAAAASAAAGPGGTSAGAGADGKLAGAGGLAAVCVQTDDAADLELDVASLGAAYLGGTRLGTLAGAGLISELRPGAVRSLSAAMTWDPAPWCPMIF